MATLDPKHEASRKALVELNATEQRRCIDISDYRHQDYVSSEVLASLVRARYGKSSGILDLASAKLYARLMTLIDKYFVKNPKWYKVVKSSSETLLEATQVVLLNLLSDANQVSFAEVRFLPWVEARTLDYLLSQVAKKNQIESLDALDSEDEASGNAVFTDGVTANEKESPEALLELKQLMDRLDTLLIGFDPKVRKAVYFKVECEYDWKQVSEFLGCSIPTARKYYKIGIEQLKKEL